MKEEDQQIVVNLVTKLGGIVLKGVAESISQKTKSIKTKKDRNSGRPTQ